MLFRNNTLVTIFILILPNIPIQYLLIRPSQKQLELRLVFVSRGGVVLVDTGARRGG